MLYLGKNVVVPAITVSGGEVTSVITATNNTGSAISEGDKVWINQENGKNKLVKYYSDTVDQSIVRGSLVINNDDVASEFSANNYLKKEFYNRYGIGDEINIKIKITSNSTGRLYSWEGVDTLFFGSDYKLYTYSWSQDNAIVVKNSLELNREYYIKATHEQGKRVYFFSLDGESYDEGVEVIDTTYPVGTDSALYLGQSHFLTASEALKGSIYLKDTNIKNNGQIVWKPYVINVTSDTQTGIAAENIFIGGTGLINVASGI